MATSLLTTTTETLINLNYISVGDIITFSARRSGNTLVSVEGNGYISAISTVEINSVVYGITLSVAGIDTNSGDTFTTTFLPTDLIAANFSVLKWAEYDLANQQSIATQALTVDIAVEIFDLTAINTNYAIYWTLDGSSYTLGLVSVATEDTLTVLLYNNTTVEITVDNALLATFAARWSNNLNTIYDTTTNIEVMDTTDYNNIIGVIGE